jgi:hypothetical protein
MVRFSRNSASADMTKFAPFAGVSIRITEFVRCSKRYENLGALRERRDRSGVRFKKRLVAYT